MSAEKVKLEKIVKMLEKKTKIKEKEKLIGIAQAVDEFAGLILTSYITEKAVNKK